MSDRQANPLAGVRPGFISLSAIFGVNVKDGTFQAHPDFPNPKTWVRDEVLASLAEAKTPDDVPPIDVFLHSDGNVVILDGGHRVLNALRRNGGKEDGPWSKIKVSRFFGDVLEAQIRSALSNLEFSRGHLTEGEEVGIVERLRKLGMSPDEILAKAGRGNKRWVSKIMKIIEATPDVLAAVKRGELSIETGSKIADHVPATEQAEVVAEAAEMEKKQGGVQTRKDLGVRKERIKVASVKAMQKRVWVIFEEVRDSYGSSKLDPETEGQWNILMFYFGFEKTPHEDIIEKLQPMFDEYVEQENNPRPVGRPKTSKKKD
jgi:hypothetical protein